MSKHVPDFINPFRAAEGGQGIAGDVAFARMGRLAEVVGNADGAAKVVLDFGVDEQDVPYVRGQIHTEVVLICQRCLEAMTVPIHVNMELGIAGTDDEAKRLPQRYDPLVVGEELISVVGLIEDEILLALPAVARHERAVCAAVKEMQGGDEKALESPTNPFAVLARLKSDR